MPKIKPHLPHFHRDEDRRHFTDWAKDQWEKLKAYELEPQKKGNRPQRVDDQIALDLAAIGSQGSHYFLTDSTNYLKRHVETLQIKSASHARRRLTIDVQLPTDPELACAEHDGAFEFWLPATFLAKYPSRANVDVRDDKGRVVPLLTRHENNGISSVAVRTAMEQLLGQPPSDLLGSLIEELIRSDGIEGEVAFLLARQAFSEEAEGRGVDEAKAEALLDSLRTLSRNYSMWVGFHGRTGERRVVKFHYDVEFARQGILRQRGKMRTYRIFGKETETEASLELEERGDKNPYLPPRRLISRAAAFFGLGAVNVGIESPYLLGSDSYHLQVESPPGVETRDLDLLATVAEDGGDAKSWTRDHGAHLYVSRAQLTEDSADLALLTLRIGRRGFMTLAWISAMVSAVTLWLFDLTAQRSIESHEATAAVLLFGPALLAAMAVKPNEHPVTTKLFAGVRFLVALNGVLVVAAAAAVARVHPEGWTFEHTWFILAIVASVGAGLVSLSWVFSWDTTYRLSKGLRRQLRTPRRYRRLCAVLSVLGFAALVAGPVLADLLPWPEWLVLVPLPPLAFACAFVATGYAGMGWSSAGRAWLAVTATGLALTLAAASMVLHLTDEMPWEKWWLALALVPLGGFVVLWVNALRWRGKLRQRRAAGLPGDPRADTAAMDLDEPGGRRQLYPQTPSGDLVRKQARDKATGIPDLIAPSAFREVPVRDEPFQTGRAEKALGPFRDAWMKPKAVARVDGDNGNRPSSQDTGSKRLEDKIKDLRKQAERERCEFVCLEL